MAHGNLPDLAPFLVKPQTELVADLVEIAPPQLRGCAVSISEIGALLYQACDRKEGRTHGCGRGSSVWVCGLPRR